MESKLYLRYSDLFDRQLSMDELVNLIRAIPIRHSLYTISSVNLCLRVVMQDDKQDFGKLQEKLLVMLLDDECLDRLQSRFPNERCEDRPVVLPECLLNVARLVIAHGDPNPLPLTEDDERIRHLIGRACLIVNDLLVSSEQARALQTGTQNHRRIELMTQLLSGFELANPLKPSHLIPRLEIMFRTLIRMPEVRARISKRANGFDFEREFESNVGISVEHWAFVLFSVYAYFLNIGQAIDPDANFMVVNPQIFRGESGITAEQLHKVLEIASASPTQLKQRMDSIDRTDSRYDFVEFRSSPLIQLEHNKLVPTDITFVLEKCHTGVQWALHDQLPIKSRQSLFNAWGALFEEYVHWLLRGMKTNLPLMYFPSPKWKDSSDESFDGILLKGPVMIPAEYKGGFVAREARYSGRSDKFLAELEKKFVVGCNQLATKIGAVFPENDDTQREVEGFDGKRVRAVVPLLVLQDHILRAPGVNWYLNKRFNECMAKQKIRTDLVVRPLTVLVVDELESIVHSVESQDFDFFYALQNRTVRDPEVLSNMLEWLSQFPDFGRKPSPRIAEVLGRVTDTITSFLFPHGTTRNAGTTATVAPKASSQE